MVTALLLAACGGGSTSGSTTSTSRTTGAIAVIDPCALLTRTVVSAAVGSATPTLTRTGPTCSYAAGANGVAVTVLPATVVNRRALAASLAHLPAHALPASGPGYRGYVVPIAGAPGGLTSQAQAVFIRGDRFVQITVTGAAGSGSLLQRATALSRAAAGRT